jgi:outer membrane protein assembly factor BamB
MPSHQPSANLSRSTIFDMRRFLTACFVFLTCLTTVAAEEWPGWRGPRGDGTSLEKQVPVHWSDTDNVAWKSPVPGIGHSSPIVWGDHIFLTSCLIEKNLSKQDQLKEFDRVLLCYDRRDGKKLWQKTVLTAFLESKHKLNSYASSTPATDGERVFVTFVKPPAAHSQGPSDVHVVCYDFQGNELWRKVPGKFISPHGFCSAPILYKDLVIINGDQDARYAKGQHKSFIVALDKKTGHEVWRVDDRPHQIRSYCAPLIVKAAGKMQMVLSGTQCVTSYDPDTGTLLWIIDGPTEQYVASLVYGDGLFFLTAGFPDYHNMAIKPDGTGNVTKTHVVWHEAKVAARKAAYVPSPIAHGKYFFLVSDLGYVSCFAAQTGKRQWMEQLGDHHSASPVSANGLLYFTSDAGDTYVLKAGPKFELVAQNPLGEECYASPALSRGQIFLRGLQHLYCIGKENNGKAG